MYANTTPRLNSHKGLERTKRPVLKEANVAASLVAMRTHDDELVLSLVEAAPERLLIYVKQFALGAADESRAGIGGMLVATNELPGYWCLLRDRCLPMLLPSTTAV